MSSKHKLLPPPPVKSKVFLLRHKELGHFVPPIDNDKSVLAYLSLDDAEVGRKHQKRLYDVDAEIVMVSP